MHLAVIRLLQAMIIARNKSTYSNILEHTKGLVFMGTPHHGASLAKHLDRLRYLLGISGAAPTTHLYSDLLPKSRTLNEINRNFADRGWGLQTILSFVEKAKTAGLNNVVVF